MRKLSPVLFTGLLISLFLSVSPAAQAEGSGTTVYGGVFTSYGFPELNENITEPKSHVRAVPVIQAGVTKEVSDSCTVDVWTSASMLRPYEVDGGNDFTNEVDVTGACGTSFKTFIGTVDARASIGWWFLGDFGRIKGDVLPVGLDLSRTFAAGDSSITPFITFKDWMGIGEKSTYLIESGARASISLGNGYSVDGTAAITLDPSVHATYAWIDGGVNKAFTDYLSGGINVKLARQIGGPLTGPQSMTPTLGVIGSYHF